MLRHKNSLSLALLLAGLLQHSTAFAYLDPGTGSILLQGLLAAIAGAAVAVGAYWEKFKTFLWRLKGTSPDKSSDDKESD